MKKTMNDYQVENQNRTYAQVANTVANKVSKETRRKPTPTLRIHTNTELRPTIAILHIYTHAQPNSTHMHNQNMTLTKQGRPTIEAPDGPPSGNLFNIKVSELFNDEDSQAALEL